MRTPKHKWKHTIVRNYLEPLVFEGKETNGEAMQIFYNNQSLK